MKNMFLASKMTKNTQFWASKMMKIYAFCRRKIQDYFRLPESLRTFCTYEDLWNKSSTFKISLNNYYWILSHIKYDTQHDHNLRCFDFKTCHLEIYSRFLAQEKRKQIYLASMRAFQINLLLIEIY